MLKLKYLFENYDLAKEALKNWEYDKEALDEMLQQFRISSNAIYPYRQNGNVCFLRLSPVEEKLEKNIYGELEFIEFLIENDYPALSPIKSKSGMVVEKLNTPFGEYYTSAFRRVAGKRIDNTDYSDKIMFTYGKVLGKLHALSEKYIPKTKKWTHTEALTWIETILFEYHAPDFVISELASIKAELSKIPIRSDIYGLVHYDFESDNVFYDEKTNTCSVIDFDDGMYHWYALDIEQVFDSLCDELDSVRYQNAVSKFIKGYKTEFHYTEEMENSLPLMRRFCNLFGYARIIRSVAEQFPDEPEWLVRLRNKLNKSIQQKEESMRKIQNHIKPFELG